MLKAYAVWEGDDESRAEYSELVFAFTWREARKLAWRKPYGGGFDEYISIRVNRVPEGDGLAVGDKPYVNADAAVYRSAGWQSPDGYSCSSCGLDDLNEDRWRVCGECFNCPECGHEEGCENAE